jgi:hypothetical protein
MRMKSGDPEAAAGLERAKAGMLRRPSAPPSDTSLEPTSSPSPRVETRPSRPISTAPASGRLGTSATGDDTVPQAFTKPEASTKLETSTEHDLGAGKADPAATHDVATSHDSAATKHDAPLRGVASDPSPQIHRPSAPVPLAGEGGTALEDRRSTESKRFLRSFTEDDSSEPMSGADDEEDASEREVSREIPITVEDEDSSTGQNEETTPGAMTADLLAAGAAAEHAPASAVDEDALDDVMVADEIAELVDNESGLEGSSTEPAPMGQRDVSGDDPPPAKGKRTVPPPLRRA